jgi:hypothetical protein
MHLFRVGRHSFNKNEILRCTQDDVSFRMTCSRSARFLHNPEDGWFRERTPKRRGKVQDDMYQDKCDGALC